MSSPAKESAENKVKQHIKDRLSKIQCIQVKQMLRLPCFTDIDRQEIRVACDREGNNLAVYTFLDILFCRDGWVTLLIDALREDNMRDLAEELQRVYDQYLPSSQRIPPAGLPPPAGPLPPAGPAPPAAANISHAQGTAAAPSDAAPPNGRGSRGIQDTGDCHVPVQENSPPAEKSKVVKPKATGKAREPRFSPPCGSHVASNSRAAVGEENASVCQTARPSIPAPPEEKQFLSPATSSLDAGSVGQRWNGRQPRPVTVKNGRFGNKNRPKPNVTAAALPAVDSVPGNQPEENYYSLDSSLSAPASQRGLQAKDLLREVEAQLPREDRTAALLDELAVLDNLPSHWDAERSKVPSGKSRTDSKASHVPVKDTPQLPPAGPLPGNSSAKSAHLSHKPLGTQPAPQTSNMTFGLGCWPPPSDFDGSSSMDVIPPNSLAQFSASLSDPDPADFKRPERKSLGKLDSTAASSVGQEKATVTRPPAVVDHGQKNCVFLSNPGEQDVPCKPGVLASVPSQPSEDTRVYSGTSERLCLSSSFSLGSDPLLVSDTCSARHPAAGPVLGRKEMNGTGSASGAEDCKDSPSIRMYGIHVVEEPSVDPTRGCEKVSLDGASSRFFLDASSDSATKGQVEGRVGTFSGTSRDSLPQKKAKAAATWIPTNMTWVLVGCGLASVALVAFGLYKKK